MELQCQKQLDLHFIQYFVEFCTFIIPNVSNNVQAQFHLEVYSGLFSFIWLPVAATSGKTPNGVSESKEARKEHDSNMTKCKTSRT